MTDSDEILSALERNQYTLSQLYDLLSLPKSTIRGRLHELYKKGLIRKFHGKFVITTDGLDQLEYSDRLPYNFLVTKDNIKSKIYAESENDAHKVAKLIYCTGYEITNIGTN